MAKELNAKEVYEQEQAEKKAAIESRIESEILAGFLNPFGEGVGYDKFLSVIPKGVSVKEYLNGKLPADKEAELILWIETDLAHYKPYASFVSALRENKNTKNK